MGRVSAGVVLYYDPLSVSLCCYERDQFISSILVFFIVSEMCALRGRGEPSQDSASAFLKGRILVGVSISCVFVPCWTGHPVRWASCIWLAFPSGFDWRVKELAGSINSKSLQVEGAWGSVSSPVWRGVCSVAEFWSNSVAGPYCSARDSTENRSQSLHPGCVLDQRAHSWGWSKVQPQRVFDRTRCGWDDLSGQCKTNLQSTMPECWCGNGVQSTMPECWCGNAQSSKYTANFFGVELKLSLVGGFVQVVKDFVQVAVAKITQVLQQKKRKVQKKNTKSCLRQVSERICKKKQEKNKVLLPTLF